MYNIGKDIGIPASFIELRHQAIHEDLPSLVVLRQAAERAIQWLYHNYWRHIDMPESSKALAEGQTIAFKYDPADLENKLRHVVRTYLKDSIATTKKEVVEVATIRVRSIAIETGRELVRLCRGHVDTQKVLVAVLLERKILVPSTKM